MRKTGLRGRWEENSNRVAFPPQQTFSPLSPTLFPLTPKTITLLDPHTISLSIHSSLPPIFYLFLVLFLNLYIFTLLGSCVIFLPIFLLSLPFFSPRYFSVPYSLRHPISAYYFPMTELTLCSYRTI